MKLNNKARIILGLLLIVISTAMLWYTMREKVYCGTLTTKINALEYNKHVSRPDPIIIVKFDIGVKKEIHPSWITFTEHEVGDRICFSQKIMEIEPTWIEPGLLGLIACFIIATAVVLILEAIGAFKTGRYE